LTDPLVVVVTPVYNGGQLLQGCIDSILAQTYSSWRLIVVDNASSDASARIAAEAAARDDRIRLERHTLHLGMLDNWNRAMSYVPDEAIYVKQLNADDRMRPDCLRRLVEVAQANPGVGVVSAYFRYGPTHLPQHDHRKVQIVRGRDAVVEVLRGGPSYLAHPSALLLRRSSAAVWPGIFDATGFPPGHPLAPPLAQADKEAYFGIMERFDLAFVPEVLADVGSGDSSATGFAARVGAWHVCRIETILRHGDRFLDSAARRCAIRSAARKYLRSLAWRFCLLAPLRDPEFVQYQRLALDHLLPRLQREDMGWESSGLRLAARLLGSRARLGSELRA
jgi:glycosyltransferase involved in cell wall biosynthesis